MKVLIEIDNYKLEAAKRQKDDPFSPWYYDAINKGVVIPDTAENGDVIEAIFPKLTKHCDDGAIVELYKGDRFACQFTDSFYHDLFYDGGIE